VSRINVSSANCLVELHKIDSKGRVGKLESYPFLDETKEFEDFIMKNGRILGDVALINHQIQIPNDGRIDIWGIDLADLRPVIIELKNEKAGLDIIPQVLLYYKFVKSYPDTLKHKALSNTEFVSRIENMGKSNKQIEESLEADPKIILVAPEFKSELLDAVDYFNIDIEPVELSRYKTENDVFVVVNRPQSKPSIGGKVITREEWNWEKYEKEGISKRKIDVAKALKGQLDIILKNEKLELEPIFRKLYIPYQHGRNNVFWIDVGYTSWETGDVAIVFNLDIEPSMEGIKAEHTKTKWFKDVNVLYIFFNKASDLSPFIDLIKKSYHYVTGR